MLRISGYPLAPFAKRAVQFVGVMLFPICVLNTGVNPPDSQDRFLKLGDSLGDAITSSYKVSKTVAAPRTGVTFRR